MSSIKPVHIKNETSISGSDVAQLVGGWIGSQTRARWLMEHKKDYGDFDSPEKYAFVEGFGNEVIFYESHFSRSTYDTTLSFYEGKLEDAVFTRSGWDLLIQPYGGEDTVKLVDYFTETSRFGSPHYPYNVVTFEFDGERYGYSDIASRIEETANLVGTDGDDVLVGGNVPNEIAGGKGADRIEGKEGNDRLFGGEGNDQLNGDLGDDALNGGKGDDILEGGFHNDILMGGDGNDTLYGAYLGDRGYSFSYVEKDVFNGGAGNDVMYVADRVDFRYSFGTFVFAGGHGQDTVWYKASSLSTNVAEFQGAQSGDARYSRSGNDLIIKAYGAEEQVTFKDYFTKKDLSLKFDDKTLSGEEAESLIFSLNLPDTAGSAGGDNAEQDKTDKTDNDKTDKQEANIAGTEGNDTLNGTDGDDIIDGKSGEDIYTGGKGNDAFAGAGEKTYIFAKGHGQDSIDADGPGSLVFEGAPAANAVFSRSGSDLVVKAYQDGSQVSIKDYFYNKNAFEFIFADKAVSHQEMLQRQFTLQGTEGDDSLNALQFPHELSGGKGNNFLSGSDGNDVFIGGEGNDEMRGDDPSTNQAGSDTYVFAIGHGQDKIVDVGSGPENTNILRFEGANLGSGSNSKFFRQGNDLIIKAYGGEDQVAIRYYFTGKEHEPGNASKLTGLDFRYFQFEFEDKTLSYDDMAGQTVTGKGTANDDTLLGAMTQDILYAGYGDDKVSGGNSGDKLYGEKGADTIWGDAGDDELNGGHGNDVLDGGLDNDKLYGESGDDKLTGGKGNDVLSGGDGNDVLEGADGADRLDGGMGNDTLTGGFGSDVLNGQLGSDTYVFSLMHGKDTISERGPVTEADTVKFTDMAMSDLMFKKQGHALVLFDEDGTGSVEISNFFLNQSFQIEHFEFSDKKVSAPDFQKYVNEADQAYSMSVFDGVSTAVAPAEVLG